MPLYWFQFFHWDGDASNEAHSSRARSPFHTRRVFAHFFEDASIFLGYYPALRLDGHHGSSSFTRDFKRCPRAHGRTQKWPGHSIVSRRHGIPASCISISIKLRYCPISASSRVRMSGCDTAALKMAMRVEYLHFPHRRALEYATSTLSYHLLTPDDVELVYWPPLILILIRRRKFIAAVATFFCY